MPTNKIKNNSVINKLSRKYCYIFQGGGALGAYQAGVYESFREYGYPADMVIGISIGGINASIIAGNRIENRIAKLKEFWDTITTNINIPDHNYLQKVHNHIGAQFALSGVPGFYKPRFINPHFLSNALPEQISYYDTSPLRETLSRLIDFEYLNQKRTRLCLGAVELKSGEFVFFDSYKQEITMDHILATGALPPAFPPVKIKNQYYIDGGVFSNTPLFKLFDEFANDPDSLESILCIMVDLFSAHDEYPSDLDGMLERIKDIRFSSHSKRPSSSFATTQNLSHAINFLGNKLSPAELQKPEVQKILKLGLSHRIDIAHLIYKSNKHELESKDYNFSKSAMHGHYKAGYDEAANLIKEKQKIWESKDHEGLTIYTQEGNFIKK